MQLFLLGGGAMHTHTHTLTLAPEAPLRRRERDGGQTRLLYLFFPPFFSCDFFLLFVLLLFDWRESN